MAAANGFMYHLSMAACEWFLMFLMFIDAGLAYVLTKFAHRCELQSPCMFCLRLDHVFGNEEPRSYLNLFCNKHRAEISCLVSCELHDKLVDVRELCDDCLMSIMKQNRFSSGSYGLTESKMGIKGYQKPPCSCCKANLNAQNLTLTGPARLGVPKLMKPPLPRIVGCSRFHRRNKFKRVRDKISANSTPCHVENSIGLDVDVDVDMDAVSDSGCADLRFDSDSDSESEVSFYEDDDTTSNAADFGEKRVSEDHSNQDPTQVEHFHSVSDLESSLLSPFSLISDSSFGHGFEEFNHNEHPSIAVSASSVPQDIDNGPPEVFEEPKSSPSRGSNHDTHSKPEEFNNEAVSASSDKDDGYESAGGASSVSEIEGESIEDKLKRQVEYDRHRLKLLQAELEEERNAAAIAADEAMAMITRLQEEKAALHMEALQYLRMMDEQAEYDMEALDKANDLVSEKDKEIQDMEAELEYFRSRYDDELMMGNGKAKPVGVNPPVLGLEDEKKYILQCLSELEKKFDQFYSQHTSISKSNGVIHQSDHSKDENILSRHKDSSTSYGSKKSVSADGSETDVNTIENEISDLNERLKALEADRNFLEHSCNMLQSNGGLEFIQEIAHHLHDLRSIRFDRRCQLVA